VVIGDLVAEYGVESEEILNYTEYQVKDNEVFECNLEAYLIITKTVVELVQFYKQDFFVSKEVHG
jgi:hypothetical protein